MARCKFCGQRIDWITVAGDKRVPVDPYPVFVVEGKGRKVFFDDMGGTVVGRQAWPEEESRDLPVAFIPHRKTCQVIRDMFGETGKR